MHFRFPACRVGRGYTLLELLVAMGLGLFLVAGLVQVIMANRAAFRFSENVSRLQEDGRFASAVISRTLSMAGYREDSTLAMTSEFPAYTTSGGLPALAFATGEVIRGNDDNPAGSADGIQDGSDNLAIRYRGATDNSTLNCLGATVASGMVSINRFYLDDESLYCSSVTVDPATGAAVGAQLSQPLIDNVADMQIRYGMSTDAAVVSEVPASCYLSAAAAPGAGDDCTTLNYDRVVSVRMALLLKSGEDNLTVDGQAQTYVFDGNTVLASDKHLYRAYASTITLRNKAL